MIGLRVEGKPLSMFCLSHFVVRHVPLGACYDSWAYQRGRAPNTCQGPLGQFSRSSGLASVGKPRASASADSDACPLGCRGFDIG